MPNKILLIDVSNLFFRAFFAFPQHLRTPEGAPCNAVYGVASIVFNLILSEKPTHIFAAQDLKTPTWRHKKLETYKSGRPEMPEDLRSQLPKVFEFFTEALDVPLLSYEGFEADDILATLSAKWRGVPDHEVLVLSADQDLLQIIGDNVFVLQPRSQKIGNEKMSAEGVMKKLGITPEQVPCYKGIAGDSSDKLVGVPGIGPKGAVQLLEQYGDLETILEHAEEVPGRKGQLLQEHKQDALDTKELAMLHYDLELDYTLECGECHGMPKNMMSFLDTISTRNLQRQAKSIFKEEVPDEQMGMF